MHTIKGALDKYNIYLSISNPIEDFKFVKENPYQIFPETIVTCYSASQD